MTKALTSWSGEKEDSLSTMDSFRDYITDLQDLPSNEEFPHRIVKEQGIWSLICREMEVELSRPVHSSSRRSSRSPFWARRR